MVLNCEGEMVKREPLGFLCYHVALALNQPSWISLRGAGEWPSSYDIPEDTVITIRMSSYRTPPIALGCPLHVSQYHIMCCTLMKRHNTLLNWTIQTYE
jgi:hypothetical protein